MAAPSVRRRLNLSFVAILALFAVNEDRHLRTTPASSRWSGSASR
jgi:hypothetical protein